MSAVRLPLDERLSRARARLEAERVDALVVLKPQNRTYLTGFTGGGPSHDTWRDGVALLTPTEVHLLIDFRYLDQAVQEAPQARHVRVSNMAEGLAELVGHLGVRRLGFESEVLTVAQWRQLTERLPEVELVPVSGLDRIRWRKDPEEVERIRRAAAIGDQAFRAVLPLVRPGVRERELALELEFQMRRAGAEALAFDVVVASGPRSAMPHGRASDRPLQAGDLVTFDFGAVVDGYRSDCTRTVVLGPATAEQRRVYETVRRAQEAAEAGLRPGMTGKAGDALARDLLAAAGYGEAFGHSLGHGVGLEVHEGPTLSPREEATLEPDVVLTVEPGIYRSGWGGVRIEDLVVLRAGGVEVLTGLPKDLLEV